LRFHISLFGQHAREAGEAGLAPMPRQVKWRIDLQRAESNEVQFESGDSSRNEVPRFMDDDAGAGAYQKYEHEEHRTFVVESAADRKRLLQHGSRIQYIQRQ